MTFPELRKTYEYTLKTAEFLSVLKANQALLAARSPFYWLVKVLAWAMWISFGFILFILISQFGKRGVTEGNAVGVAFIAMSACYFSIVELQRRWAIKLLTDGSHLTDVPRTLALETDGLTISSYRAQLKYNWSSFTAIEVCNGTVSLFLDKASFYPIAAEAFVDDEERNAFVAHLRARIAEAALVEPAAMQTILPARAQDAAVAVEATQDLDASPIAPVEIPPIPAPENASAIPGLQKNIVTAFRLAFFRSVPVANIHVSGGQLICFAVLSMVAPVLWALGTIGVDGQFNFYGLPGAVFHVPVLLLAAVSLSYLLRTQGNALLLLQMFLMIGFATDIVYYAAYVAISWLPRGFQMRPYGFLSQYGPAMWLSLACAVAAARMLPLGLNKRLSSALICLLTIALPFATVYRDRNLWTERYDDEERASKRTASITSEENFYRQPALLATELENLQSRRPGINLYFIGMAGYGSQNVFRREVDAVAKLFTERFGAEGHTIKLINSDETLASAPIASVTSLGASLKRTAEIMDKEQDILFLFLTSHGSENHRFSLDLWPMQFDELDPKRLRRLLDDSGIKHRVVVVSACYSGGFINDLKDDNTLVITASAANRNSFGCGNNNDWTYFGRAYFDEALRKTDSFTEAFALANPVISEREKKEDFSPSHPQISIGKNIETKLNAFQAQLKLQSSAQTAQETTTTSVLRSTSP
jgi:hypothetical protein